tara:strand:+ start:1354 stop:1815 length:462 start_codon:yes stop_codon:yes gene_type:complete
VDDLMNVLVFISMISMAVMGGVYFVFSVFVMQSLAQIRNGAEVMVKINQVILHSLFLPLFFLSSGLAAFIIVLNLLVQFDALLFMGSAVYILGMFACTAVCNVPLNKRLEAAHSSSGKNPFWAEYLQRWTRWNHVRTISSVLGAAALYAAGSS